MKLAAPLLAVAATSLSLGAAATAATVPGTWGQIVHMNPDPSVAWMLAIGFLGLVVLRRTRSGPLN